MQNIAYSPSPEGGKHALYKSKKITSNIPSLIQRSLGTIKHFLFPKNFVHFVDDPSI